MLAFAAEAPADLPEEPAVESPRATDSVPASVRGGRSRTWTWQRLVPIALVLGAAIAGYALLQAARPSEAAVAPVVATTGVAQFHSQPEGAAVTVDGATRGVTPLTLNLPAGRHVADLQNGGSSKQLVFEVAAGSTVSQYVELAPPVDAAPAGRLEISSDPAGAPVTLDGSSAGVTPLSLKSVAPGAHTVIVGQGDAATRQSVTVAAGATATVFVSAARGPAAGWVTLKAPFDMQIFEPDGQLVGSTASDRVMLTAGRHDLRLANSALAFETQVTVQVAAGKTTTASVVVPNGELSVNALPWAQVWIDGQEVGTTPLGNLSVAVGSHQVVWRHPELGERRQTVVVKAQTPTRVGIDLRNPQ